jgi:aryl-alcohol dehydrogenase-like predicted oxidoreductase
MEYRQFGKTDLQVSAVGFGAWAIGGGEMVGTTAIGWGDVDDAVSKKAIFAALDAGINFFDTADIYGLGHSEQILGETIGREKNVVIASKVGNVARNNTFTFDYDKNYIIEACEASLRRLKRTHIDYYQLHTARLPHLETGDCIVAMQQLQQTGKIRHWGVSLNTFAPTPEAEWLLQRQFGAGFQLVYNLINQHAANLMQQAAHAGYGVIARMPLQFGLLTGKFDNAAEFANNDHRKKRLTKAVIDAANQALLPVWQLCEKYECDKTTLAMSFILNNKNVSTVIPGIRTAAQVMQNTQPTVELEAPDLALIGALGEKELVALMQLIQQQG